ncbi:2,3-bisphosphoglycerate-independent phosphoglycerate mutase [Candidatus Bandiella euplotis]|uniref:2,3-bisphosphoglycerate-independent phosphoglycerate mutase n=1 Tax=Candidatus Bandiella euplotis TaxID=1664265 RepID=A0ABZ0UPE1_9RICK|nr:2,3-bisphosphoglycerate-independent phosphoglycerate mutase [Candidatus Bandiella woodruffii]WPX97126.1 2,3-bisphosphoglycerate-independent phosphoglycerate mutase [Candidatus Bandiella woodruffii]
MTKNKLLLCILDGWGCSANKEHNAIYLADTPCMDNLQLYHPHSLIKTSGESVGLPNGQMGNSEVGHTTIGAGRVIFQSLLRLNQLTKSHDDLSNNLALKKLINKTGNKVCHILGMISDGGVHSHIDHIIAIAQFLSQQGVKVILHAFTDGRDTSPQSAINYVQKISEREIHIASISGRYYAMDRDKRLERVSAAYNAITGQSSTTFDDAKDYIEHNYDNNVSDEFIIPAQHKDYMGFQDGDSLLVTNFRADRIRQLLEIMLVDHVAPFSTQKLMISYAAGMIEYSENLSSIMGTILQNNTVRNDLGEHLSNLGLRQLRIAETEKYAHVTYFFNCGREKQVPGEDWMLIPSAKVKTYDLNPEMSAHQITDTLINLAQNGNYDFICVNYANADMVGHTGNLEASIKACSTIDQCVSKLVAFCKDNNFDMLITADHGNAEQMMEESSEQAKTSHTMNDVPLIYFGTQAIKLKNGELSDIAPTILDLLKLPKPQEMDGNTLITLIRD